MPPGNESVAQFKSGVPMRTMFALARPDSLSPFRVDRKWPGWGSELLERTPQSLDFRALRGVRRQSSQQFIGSGCRVGTLAEARVGEREVEARFVEIGIGRERRLQRAHRGGVVAAGRLQDA